MTLQSVLIILSGMLYRVHFAADAHEPFPPVESLAKVEARDPLAAVESLVKTGRVPQDGVKHWARVILNLHPNGKPWKVLRVPITPTGQIPFDWR